MVSQNIPRPALFSFEDSSEDIERISNKLCSLKIGPLENILSRHLTDKYIWPKEFDSDFQVSSSQIRESNDVNSLSIPPPRLSAVLVPLIYQDDTLKILFTLRSPNLRNHSGQISFPGGKKELNESPNQTALRETYEEIGVEPDTVSLVGQFKHLYTLGMSNLIVPVVGKITEEINYRLSSEVTEIFTFEIAKLITQDVYSREVWHFSKTDFRVMHFFKIEDHIIWGATARIIYDLLDLIATAS